MAQSRNTKRSAEFVLGTAHYNQVLRRHDSKHRSMQSIMGVTWHITSRSQRLSPIGTVPMMVMFGGESPEEYRPRLWVGMFLLQFDPAAGTFHYADLKRGYDFMRSQSPYSDVSMDPRDPRPQRGKHRKFHACGDQLWTALHLDSARVEAVEKNWRLPAVPTLPKIWLGAADPAVLPLEVTPAMERLIANHMGVPRAHLQTMSEEQIKTLAQAHWGELWRSPDHPENNTGMWLIEHQYSTQPKRASQIYEDFSELLGESVPNPLQQVDTFHVRNPASSVFARQTGEKLEEVLRERREAAAAGDDGTAEEFDAALAQLVPQLRNTLGEAANGVDDATLTMLFHNYKQPLVRQRSELLHDHDDILASVGRSQLFAQNDYTPAMIATDTEICEAIKTRSPLMELQNMCRPQAVYCDWRMVKSGDYVLEPAQLGRDRVYADFSAAMKVGAPVPGYHLRKRMREEAQAAKAPKERELAGV